MVTKLQITGSKHGIPTINGRFITISQLTEIMLRDDQLLQKIRQRREELLRPIALRGAPAFWLNPYMTDMLEAIKLLLDDAEEATIEAIRAEADIRLRRATKDDDDDDDEGGATSVIREVMRRRRSPSRSLQPNQIGIFEAGKPVRVVDSNNLSVADKKIILNAEYDRLFREVRRLSRQVSNLKSRFN